MTIAPADFFVIRSPLLEGDGADNADVDATLSIPAVREALGRASPSLAAALEGRASHHDVMPAVMRYLRRMQARATPFSLLAGYAVGEIGGSSTEIRFGPRADYIRSVRIEVHCIARVLRELTPKSDARWITRRDLMILPDVVRCSTLADGAKVTLADFARSAPLDRLLEVARSPKSISELAADLQVSCGATAEEASAFVDAMVDNALIVPDSTPPLLLDDELSFWAARPRAQPLATMARNLRHTKLSEQVVDRVKALSSAIAAIDPSHSPQNDFIYDLVKPSEHAMLGGDALEALTSVVAVLPRVAIPERDPNLADFESAFAERYGEQEIPVVEALDPRRGIPFGVGIRQRPAVESERTRRLDRWLMDVFDRGVRASAHEVTLTPKELPADRSEWKLPPSFAIRCALAENPLCVWSPSIVPATVFFARGAGASPSLRECARRFLARVAAASPDVDFADVPYDSGQTSASQFPPLQATEISLSATTADPDKAIDVNDIFLSIRDGGCVLRDRSGRRIHAAVTGALDLGRDATATDLARFLYALARDGNVLSWKWRAFGIARALPRVKYLDHVLSPARWSLRSDEMRGLKEKRTREKRWDAVQTLRSELGVPRLVRVLPSRGDNVLAVDFENPLNVEAWLDSVKRDEAGDGDTTLEETFPIERSAVRGPEGRFHHEIVVPFMVEGGGDRSAKWDSPPIPPDVGVECIVPGGDELTISFFGDSDELLNVLLGAIQDCLEPCVANKTLSHWFFEPSSRPSEHVRVSLFGTRSALWSDVLAALREGLNPYVQKRIVRRVTVDTYQREIYRYGGKAGMDLSERLFCESSRIAAIHHAEGPVDLDLEAGIVSIVSAFEVFASCLAPEPKMTKLLDALLSDPRARADAKESQLWAGKTYRQVSKWLLELPDVATRIGSECEAAIRSLVSRFEVEASAGNLTVPLDAIWAAQLHEHAVRLLTTWRYPTHVERGVLHMLSRLLLTRAAVRRAVP